MSKENNDYLNTLEESQKTEVYRAAIQLRSGELSTIADSGNCYQDGGWGYTFHQAIDIHRAIFEKVKNEEN